MARKVWITLLGEDEGAARELAQTAQAFGLEVQGHLWKDDLAGMEWAGPVSELGDPKTGLWLICGANDHLAQPSIRQGLSLLALAAQARRGGVVPTMVLCGKETGKEDLPWALHQAVLSSPDNPSLGSKIAARANMPDKTLSPQFRLNCYAIPKAGLWLEAGPAEQDWNGVLVGVLGAKVEAMGIGQQGKIPDRSVLEYPVRDMQLSMGGDEYTAWACQNVVRLGESSYVKVNGTPESLLFGAFEPDNETPELFHLPLI